jgi:RNA polymerase sigma-70 factor (ECF subfamily)
MDTATTVGSDGHARHARVEEMIRVHGQYLHRLARRLCRPPVDPEDLVQDVFERALRAASLPEEDVARAWLSRVLYNLFIDRLRRQHVRHEPLVDDPPDRAAADTPAWWESLGEPQIRAELARLSEAQRATFELFSFHDKSYRAIAAELGIAMATVGTRVLRARETLRLRLTERYG